MVRRWQVKFTDIPNVLRAYRHLMSAGFLVFFRSHEVSRWVKSSETRTTERGTSQQDWQTIANAARWTNRASRHPWEWARCLQRSVAMCQWLEREGLEPRLVIGVRRVDSGISGHAWVEYAGKIVNDVPAVEGEFTTLQLSSARQLALIDRWSDQRSQP